MIDAAEVARLRQGLYRLFGATLTYPAAGSLTRLRAAVDYLSDAGVVDFGFYGPWAAFADECAGAVDEEALGVEYVRLFASGTDGALCPPIESYYVAHAEGGGIAAAVAVVQHAYQELGVNAATDEPPDHAATEMEALSALCAREARWWEAQHIDDAVTELKRQHLFLGAHPLRWFPRFLDRVETSGAHAFYGSAARAAHAFLVHDRSWTKELARTLGPSG